MKKTNKTVSICSAKIDTIKHIVFRALQDNQKNHEEFMFIEREVDKYQEVKKKKISSNYM